jgi:hypothetical protein
MNGSCNAVILGFVIYVDLKKRISFLGTSTVVICFLEISNMENASEHCSRSDFFA